MKWASLVVATLVTHTASAQVPIRFSANTPAKASEVNLNFEALDSDIQSVKAGLDHATSRLTILENKSDPNPSTPASPACASSDGWWSKKHKVTYAAKVAAVGQTLTYGGTTYRMVALPFREFSTGNMYQIKLPIKETTPNQVAGSLMTEHVSNATPCSQLSISGYPAFGDEVSETRQLSYYNNGSLETTSRLTTSYSVNIKVIETNLIIPISIDKSETSATISAGDYDFTNDLNHSTMQHDTTLVDHVDNLIDYIQIQPL